ASAARCPSGRLQGAIAAGNRSLFAQRRLDVRLQKREMLGIVGPQDVTATGCLEPEAQAKIPVHRVAANAQPLPAPRQNEAAGGADTAVGREQRRRATLSRRSHRRDLRALPTPGTMHEEFVAEVIDGLPGILKSRSVRRLHSALPSPC